MPLFHFKPKPEGLFDPNWKASTHKGDCFVNAANLNKAIGLVKVETARATKKERIGQEIPVSPWGNLSLVDIIEAAHLGGDLPPEDVVMLIAP